MRAKFLQKDICYLCNKHGADTNDHIPPKGLFEIKDPKLQRLTLPAHNACNNHFSKDEEYFRDVIIQQAEAFSMSDIENIRKKVWRSWSKGGWKRYQDIIKTAKHAFIRKDSVLVPVITVEINQDIMKSIATKIARGIIFNDTGAFTQQSDYVTTGIRISDVPNLREKDKNELYWKVINSSVCEHTFFGPNFAARRSYIVSTGDYQNPIITCIMGLIAISQYFIICVEIPFKNITNLELKFLAM